MPTQVWGTVGSGGYLANAKLSKKIRHAAQPQMRFHQFVRAEPGFGLHMGDTYDFNKISNLTAIDAIADVELAETSTVGEDTMSITRGQLIVKEYGKAVPFTGKLANLADNRIEPIAEQVLRNQMAKFMDLGAASAFTATDYLYIPVDEVSGTWDTDGTASTSASANLDVFHLKEIHDRMFGTLKVPKFPDGYYVCIASTKAIRGIIDHADFEEAVKYQDASRLWRGEVGKIAGFRVIEENHILSNSAGSGGVLGKAICFGEDPVVMTVAEAAHLRQKIPTADYGRDRGIGWFFTGMWGITWDFSSDGETRVVYVTSS